MGNGIPTQRWMGDAQQPQRLIDTVTGSDVKMVEKGRRGEADVLLGRMGWGKKKLQKKKTPKPPKKP